MMKETQDLRGKPRCGEKPWDRSQQHQNPTNNNFKRNELLGEASAVATGAFALVHKYPYPQIVLLLLNFFTLSFVFLY